MIGRIAICVVLSTSLCAPAHSAENSSSRKVVSQVQPRYPDVAKPMHLNVIVKLQASVEPNGHVKDIKVLGGGPVFIEAAMTAVRKWKYEPAAQDSTEYVEIKFRA